MFLCLLLCHSPAFFSYAKVYRLSQWRRSALNKPRIHLREHVQNTLACTFSWTYQHDHHVLTLQQPAVKSHDGHVIGHKLTQLLPQRTGSVRLCTESSLKWILGLFSALVFTGLTIHLSITKEGRTVTEEKAEKHTWVLLLCYCICRVEQEFQQWIHYYRCSPDQDCSTEIFVLGMM